MSQTIDSLLAWAMPKPIQYLGEEIKDDITDLTLGRKVYRNIFRLSTTAATMTLGGLLPTVIASDTLGTYLNDLFSSILGVTNTALLSTCSALLCGVIAGTVSMRASKEIFRLINHYLHGETNSNYNFDAEKIKTITENYSEQYKNISPQLIEKKVKEDIQYMLTLIKEKRNLDKELSASVKEYKKNPAKMEIISPKDPLSKAELKLMLALYVHGDDQAFKAHLSLYPKVQTLYIEHYAKPAIEMCHLAQTIESHYPDIATKSSIHNNAEYLRTVGSRENIVPSLPPLHPLFDVMDDHVAQPAHAAIHQLKDYHSLESIVIESDSDDEKQEEEKSITNPLSFLEPYVRQQTLEKRRASFRPNTQPKIDKAFAEELHHDIEKIVAKMTQAVQKAEDKKVKVQKRKRKTI